jgi:hypothetical protein
LPWVKEKGSRQWLFQCACGKQIVTRLSSVVKGRIKSCGCKHGGTGTLEYDSWRSMQSRCNNVKAPNYCHYGAKGITVDPRWNDFGTFLADMGPRPSKGHSIDRYPDKFGNYEPSNCRWATATEQARNRRNGHILTHDGLSLTIAEWAELKGWSYHSISGRIKQGWSVADALNKPIRHRKKKPTSQVVA